MGSRFDESQVVAVVRWRLTKAVAVLPRDGLSEYDHLEKCSIILETTIE